MSLGRAPGEEDAIELEAGRPWCFARRGEEEGGDLRREPCGETGVGWMAAAARRGAGVQGGRRGHFGPKCGRLTGCGGVAVC